MNKDAVDVDTDVDTDATPEVTDPQGRPSDYFYVKENGSGEDTTIV